MNRSLCRIWSISLVLSLILSGLLAYGIAEATSTEHLTVHGTRDVSREGDTEDKWDWAVGLLFNHAVFPANLEALTTVTVDGSAVEFKILSKAYQEITEESPKAFVIVPAQRGKGAGTVEITIDKGLTDITGRKTLQKTFVQKFVTSRPVSVNQATTFFKTAKNKGVRLQFSQRLTPRDVMKAISITPAVPNLSVYSEGNWIMARGDFLPDKKYMLHVAPLKLTDKSVTLKKYEYDFTGPSIKADVEFKTTRSVVELKGRQLLPLAISNLPQFRSRLFQIPAYLLPEAKETDPAEMERKAQDLKAQAQTAGLESRFFSTGQDTEVFFAPESQEKTLAYSLPLSFRKNPDMGGAWLLSLSDTESKWKSDKAKLLQVTDLAISYKISEKTLLVWVTSLHTGEPVPGVSIMLRDRKDHRFFVGNTNNDGVLMVQSGQSFPSVRLEKTGKLHLQTIPLKAGDVDWVVAATDTDSSGMRIPSNELKPGSVTQTANIKDKPEFRTGVIFTERGVYKPGESVHFKFTARAYNDGIVSPKGDAVNVQITSPRDDVVYSKDFALGEFGSCYDTFELKPFFAVGTYTIKATITRADKKQDSFTQTFLVQEFKKIRHFVNMTMKPTQREQTGYVGVQINEEYLEIDVEGRYYTGGPVKNAKVRWKAMLVPADTRVPGYDGYTFGNEEKEAEFLESGEAMLDAAGKLTFGLPLDSKLMTGAYGVKISATILDVDGEPATGVETYTPKTNYRVGIANHPEQVESGYTGDLGFVVIDAAGKPVGSGTVTAVFMNKEYFYSLKRDETGAVKQNWENGWIKSYTSQQPITNGRGFIPIAFSNGGDFLVDVIYKENDAAFAGRAVFTVGWSNISRRENEDQELVTKAEILLTSNKKTYKTGDDAQVRFRTPRPTDKCLVTLEKGGVLEYALVRTEKGAGVFNFPIKDAYKPNVYVSVLAPSGRQGYPVYMSQSDGEAPIVYYGYTDLSIRNENTTLHVEIAPENPELKGRPGEPASVSLKVTGKDGAGASAEVALCVVDEAILALTRYRTPNLSSLTKFDLPLAVFQGDLRLDLISQDLMRLIATKPLTGGGGGLADVGPGLRKDFRPVAYYNPAIVTGADGLAKVEFTLPDTTTAYRIFAVACNKTAGFASTQRNMVVTKEFFLTPSPPRFLVVGDQAQFPVTLSNKTPDIGTAQVEATAGRGLSLDLQRGETVLDPFANTSLSAFTNMKDRVEKAVFTFQGSLKTDKASFTDEIEMSIPVLSKYPPITRIQAGDFTQETHVKAEFPGYLADLDADALTPMDLKARLSVSRTPWVRLAPVVAYLMHYPYGCIEQTSSGVIPLLGIRELAKDGAFPGVDVNKVNTFVESGIDRILSMQLAEGGFSYWPGQLEESWWGSLYATFALLNAQKTGFTVPQDRLDKAMNFVRERLFKGGDPNDTYHTWARELAVYELALTDRLSVDELDTFLDRWDKIGYEGKAFLVLAAQAMKASPRKELKKSMSEFDVKYDPKRDDYNNSSFREIAVSLLAGLKTGAPTAKLDTWAGMLIRGLKPEGRWNSTADSSWCLLALSDYYKSKRMAAGKTKKLTVIQGDKTTDVTMSDASADIELDAKALMAAPLITIKADSKDLINYTLTLVYPSAPEQAAGERTLGISKIIENLNGAEEIRVGDVVRVTLNVDLQGDGRRLYEYIALEDPVPAGLVPINTELKTEGVDADNKTDDEALYFGGLFIPSHQEIRDDGVRVFKDRTHGGSYKYTYLARAAIAGEFLMRGSRISLMYQPDIYGSIPGKMVKVSPAGK